MTLSDFLAVVGLIIGAAGTGVAFWEAKKSKTLREYLKIEAIGDYHRATIMLGSAQLCLLALAQENTTNALCEAGKAQGAAETIFSKTIENIQHRYCYTNKDVDQWIQGGKIPRNHESEFRKYAET